MYIVIIGGGKVGYYLAKELVEANHEVLVVEKDSARCEAISSELGEIAQRGDGCEASTQEAVGVGRADLLLAVTGDDEDNLVACQVAKHIFSVPRTVARLNNPKNETIFRTLGIDVTVSATAAVLSHIEQELPSHKMISLGMLPGGRGYEMVEVMIPPDAAVVGRMVRDIELPKHSIIWGIVDTEGDPKTPSGETELRGGDEVVAVTLRENEEALRTALTAPPPTRSF